MAPEGSGHDVGFRVWGATERVSESRVRYCLQIRE